MVGLRNLPVEVRSQIWRNATFSRSARFIVEYAAALLAIHPSIEPELLSEISLLIPESLRATSGQHLRMFSPYLACSVTDIELVHWVEDTHEAGDSQSNLIKMLKVVAEDYYDVQRQSILTKGGSVQNYNAIEQTVSIGSRLPPTCRISIQDIWSDQVVEEVYGKQARSFSHFVNKKRDKDDEFTTGLILRDKHEKIRR